MIEAEKLEECKCNACVYGKFGISNLESRTIVRGSMSMKKKGASLSAQENYDMSHNDAAQSVCCC